MSAVHSYSLKMTEGDLEGQRGRDNIVEYTLKEDLEEMGVD